MLISGNLRSATGVFVIGTLLASCGGGSGSVQSVPALPSSGGAKQAASLTVNLNVPITRTASAHLRKPQYVSTSTQSFAITVGVSAPVNVNVSSLSPACNLGSTLVETTTSAQPTQIMPATDGSGQLWYGTTGAPFNNIGQILYGGAKGKTVNTYDAGDPSYYDKIIAVGPDVDGSFWAGSFNAGTFSVGHVTGRSSYAPVAMGTLGSFHATSFAQGAAAGDEYFTYADATPTLQPSIGHITAGAIDATPHGILTGNALRVKAGAGRVWLNESDGSVAYMPTDGTYTVHAYVPAGAGSLTYQAGLMVAPDNSLYFVMVSGTQPSIGHLAADFSSFTTISLPAFLNNAQITGLTLGPDGAIWMASITNGLFRVTTAGVVSGPYATPLGGAGAGVDDIATGSDKAIYFTEYNSAYYGRVALSYACSATVPVPPGSTTVTIKAYDGQNATGNLLSQTLNNPVTVSANGTTNLSFTLDGIVDHVNLVATPNPAPLGCFSPYAGSTTISAQAVDAGGNIIIGSGGVADAAGNPLQLLLSAAQPTVSFSAPTLAWPAPTSSTATISNLATTPLTFSAVSTGATPANVPHGINPVSLSNSQLC